METVNDDADLVNYRDDRDLVIAELSDCEALLRERVASLEADVAAYRELSVAACDALHQLTVRHQRLQHRSEELRAEYEDFRARMMLEAIDDRDEAAA